SCVRFGRTRWRNSAKTRTLVLALRNYLVARAEHADSNLHPPSPASPSGSDQEDFQDPETAIGFPRPEYLQVKRLLNLRKINFPSIFDLFIVLQQRYWTRTRPVSVRFPRSTDSRRATIRAGASLVGFLTRQLAGRHTLQDILPKLMVSLRRYSSFAPKLQSGYYPLVKRKAANSFNLATRLYSGAPKVISEKVQTTSVTGAAGVMPTDGDTHGMSVQLPPRASETSDGDHSKGAAADPKPTTESSLDNSPGTALFKSPPPASTTSTGDSADGTSADSRLGQSPTASGIDTIIAISSKFTTARGREHLILIPEAQRMASDQPPTTTPTLNTPLATAKVTKKKKLTTPLQ
ncbi:hypothetical protein FB451DRAFT_381651, partial [Mycena latifolia]